MERSGEEKSQDLITDTDSVEDQSGGENEENEQSWAGQCRQRPGKARTEEGATTGGNEETRQ